MFRNARVCVRAEDLSCMLGEGNIPIGGAMNGTTGVQGLAGQTVRGGSVREETLLYCVHEVVVRTLLCSRADWRTAQKASPQALAVVVNATLGDVEERSPDAIECSLRMRKHLMPGAPEIVPWVIIGCRSRRNLFVVS